MAEIPSVHALAAANQAAAQNATLAAALPHLERAVRDHFETPCC